MKTPQLCWIALIAASVAVGACNRTQTSREANEAGERLADSWLTTKIQAQFFADDDIKSRYINVTTRDGVVTLRGHVESEDVRRQALEIARNTDGIRGVEDQLGIGTAPADAFASREPGAVATTGSDDEPIVHRDTSTVLEDNDITTMIQAKYFVHDAMKQRTIDVATNNGVVTLRGGVASDEERAQALLLARTTEGVQRVEDSLTVDASLAPVQPPQTHAAPAASVDATAAPAPRPEDASVEGAIKEKLSADARLKAAPVEVSAKDGVVLLQGTVADQATKQRVLTAARETQGVVQVVDRLTVSTRR